MTAVGKPPPWTVCKRSVQAAVPPVVAAVASLALAFFMLVLPGTIIYTVVWGERAVATVEACTTVTRFKGEVLDCRGSWRFADGTRESGHVSGVGTSDVGKEVPVRVGPLGPYAGGLGRSGHTLLVVAPMWLGFLLAAVLIFRVLRRARAQTREVLAEVCEGGGPVLTVRRRVRDDRGRTLLDFRTSARPPHTVTGIEPGQGEGGRYATLRPFVSAHASSGGVEFFLVRLTWGFGLFDPDGRLALAVRRTTRLPLRAEILAPDRTPLGRIVPYPDPDRAGAAYALTTETGRPVAYVVGRRLHWIVVLSGDPPELLRRAAMAFAFDAVRLGRQ